MKKILPLTKKVNKAAKDEEDPSVILFTLENSQKRAINLYNQRFFAECVELCDAIIKEGIKDGPIYNTKATALAQLEQYDKALEAITIAVELEEGNEKFAKNKRIIEAKWKETKPKDSPIYTLKGTDGILHLYSDRLVIERPSKFLAGKKKDKEIFLSNIEDIKIKGSGLTAGYIRFILVDRIKKKEGWLDAFTDENSVTFMIGKRTAEKIDARIKVLTK